MIKMYITINNIKGEKRIDLSYSIQNFDSDKEIAVIRMLSDNVKYEILKLRSVMDPISDTKKIIPKGAYAGRELISMREGIIELNQFEVDDEVTKTNNPGVGSMGKSMEFMGRPWFPHASHASLAFPCYAKAWKSMGSMEIFFKLHQQSMD